jgi:hypothetical protein
MLYQLPCGKVLNISVDEYLNLSDRELYELAHSGFGDPPPTKMFYGDNKTTNELNKPVDTEFLPETDDTDVKGPVDIKNLPEEL